MSEYANILDNLLADKTRLDDAEELETFRNLIVWEKSLWNKSEIYRRFRRISPGNAFHYIVENYHPVTKSRNLTGHATLAPSVNCTYVWNLSTQRTNFLISDLAVSFWNPFLQWEACLRSDLRMWHRAASGEVGLGVPVLHVEAHVCESVPSRV